MLILCGLLSHQIVGKVCICYLSIIIIIIIIIVIIIVVVVVVIIIIIRNRRCLSVTLLFPVSFCDDQMKEGEMGGVSQAGRR